MARCWRLMGHYNAETATYSACAGTAQTSPWTPDFSGRLIGIKTQCSLAAATSLSGHMQFRLQSTNFKPNQIEVYAQGHGIETAPANSNLAQEFAVDQPVLSGNPIAIEGRCVDSVPVTVETFIYGCFDVA